MFSYSLETGAGEVRASRQLGEGEELSLAWVDPLSGAADRQKMLQVDTSSTSSTDPLILHVQGKYNFQCECEVCSLDPEQLAANDKIRREILGLTNNMEDIFVTNPQKAFRFAKMKVERMEAIRGEMVELLPSTYLDCYELCLALGEREIAEIFAVKGRQLAAMLRGDNSLWSKIR